MPKLTTILNNVTGPSGEFGTTTTQGVIGIVKLVRWICENPECRAEFSEYVNGCPKCYEGRLNSGLVPLHFSVRALPAAFGPITIIIN